MRGTHIKKRYFKERMEAKDIVKNLHEFIELHYRDELLGKIRKGEKFLVIDFAELSKFDPEAANSLLDSPEDIIKAAEIAVESFDMFGDVSDFRIRFMNLPKTQNIMLKDIRSVNIGKFVTIQGIIRQKSDVRPQVTTAKFECPSCGNVIAVSVVGPPLTNTTTGKPRGHSLAPAGGVPLAEPFARLRL